MFKRIVSLGLVGIMLLSAVLLTVVTQTNAKGNPNNGGGQNNSQQPNNPPTPPTNPGQGGDNGASELCTDLTAGLGYETKVDTVGDPSTVTYTAPDGFLVAAYCVKASTDAIIIDVMPDAKTVVIDHPTVNSVSHYQVLLIADEREEPIAVSLQLTYMQQQYCEGNAPVQNEWLVRNTTSYNIPFTTNLNNQDTAIANQDTFIYTAAGSQTMILSWGGGDSGFVAGSTTIAGGQNILLDADDPRCVVEEEPEDAVLSVNIQVLPRNCEVGQQLIYDFTVEGATLVEGSTTSGVFGAGPYSISFTANEGFVLTPQDGGVLNDDATIITFSGELAGSLDPTSPECVLGEENPEEPVIPGTPVTPETPDVLPNTSASSPATIISILAGLTAAIALAGATLRTTLYKGLNPSY